MIPLPEHAPPQQSASPSPSHSRTPFRIGAPQAAPDPTKGAHMAPHPGETSLHRGVPAPLTHHQPSSRSENKKHETKSAGARIGEGLEHVAAAISHNPDSDLIQQAVALFFDWKEKTKPALSAQQVFAITQHLSHPNNAAVFVNVPSSDILGYINEVKKS